MIVNLSLIFRSGQRKSFTIIRAKDSFWALTAAAAVAVTVMFSFARIMAGQSQPRPHPIILPEANRLPDANDQMEMREKNMKKQQFEAANTERLRQMNQESEGLLTVAMALKAEVDNSSKSGGFSANAIRKADAIEKLARNVKEKMKLTVRPN
jgi:hypothetical protein